MVSMRIIMIGKGEQKADRCTEVLLRIAGYKYDYQNCIVNCYIFHENVGIQNGQKWPKIAIKSVK